MDWSNLQKRCVIVVAVLYAGWSVWTLVMYSTGNVITLGANYFSTWDMFPGYETWSHRTFAVGQTTDGRAVQLYPGPREQFSTRPGGITRLDFFPSYSFPHAQPLFHTAIQRQLNLFSRIHPEIRVERVLVIEQFWPTRANAGIQPEYLPPCDEDARYSRPLTEWLAIQDGNIVWDK